MHCVRRRMINILSARRTTLLENRLVLASVLSSSKAKGRSACSGAVQIKNCLLLKMLHGMKFSKCQMFNALIDLALSGDSSNANSGFRVTYNQ